VKFGTITVFCGSMFSGKTGAAFDAAADLEKAYNKAAKEGSRPFSCVYFKHVLDTRYTGKGEIRSHDNQRRDALIVGCSADIYDEIKRTSGTDVVVIDEGQFFDDGIVDVVWYMSGLGIDVIVAGLDMDYMCRPYGPMPALMAISSPGCLEKLSTICAFCGEEATLSFRIGTEKGRDVVGGGDIYRALCRECYRRGVEYAKS